jgi:hypothetical protein
MTTPASSWSAGSLANRALAHVQRLAGEIGPRPAGSPAERQAQDEIAALLEGWGYAVQRLEAPFAPPAPAWTQIAAGALFCLAAWLLPRWPWPALALPLLIAALPQLTLLEISLRPRRAASQNLLAGEVQDGGLVFVAHVDSARALPFAWMRRLDALSMTLLQRLALALAALGILRLLGLRLPPPLYPLAAALGALACAWLAARQLVLWRSRLYSPGAHDNASGVGALLALAEHFAAHPPAGAPPAFLFTGAEETGLHGARAFAETMQQSELHARFVVLDMVGAGETLRLISTDGVFFPLRANRELNDLLLAANPALRPLRYTLRSGDHAAFLRSGFPAAALQSSGSSQAEGAYHTPGDVMAVIQPRALESVIATLLRLV